MAVVVEVGDGDGAVVFESEMAIGSVVEVGTGAGTGVGVGAGAGTGTLAGVGTSSSEACNFVSVLSYFEIVFSVVTGYFLYFVLRPLSSMDIPCKF